eukprot:6194946-Pleurochrysis_carterae.AAC.2
MRRHRSDLCAGEGTTVHVRSSTLLWRVVVVVAAVLAAALAPANVIVLAVRVGRQLAGHVAKREGGVLSGAHWEYR